MGDAEFNLKVKIINEVKQRPLIFNKAHPKHYLRAQREKEFDTIGTVLGISGKSISYTSLHGQLHYACHGTKEMFKNFDFYIGAEVEKKWKNLTDQFRTKIKSGAAGASELEKAAQWRFYDLMSFMKTYIAAKK